MLAFEDVGPHEGLKRSSSIPKAGVDVSSASTLGVSSLHLPGR